MKALVFSVLLGLTFGLPNLPIGKNAGLRKFTDSHQKTSMRSDGMKTLLLLFIFVVRSLNAEPPTTQHINPATGNPIDPKKAPVKDNLGTPTAQHVNPATGNPVDPTKTVPKDNLGKPAAQHVNPATGNPIDPTKTK